MSVDQIMFVFGIIIVMWLMSKLPTTRECRKEKDNE